MFMNPMMTQGMSEEMRKQMQQQMMASMGARMMMAGGQGKPTGEALGSSVLGGMGDAESMMRAGLQTQMQGMQLNKLKQESEARKNYMDMLSGMETPEGPTGKLAMGSARMGNPTMLANALNPSKIMHGNVDVGDQQYPYLFSQDAMGGQSGAKFMPQPNAYSMMSGMFGSGGDDTTAPPAAPVIPPPKSLQEDVGRRDKTARAKAVSDAAAKETATADKQAQRYFAEPAGRAGFNLSDLGEARAKVMYGNIGKNYNIYSEDVRTRAGAFANLLKQHYGF